MTEQTAFTVFITIFAGGVGVWLLALHVHRRAFRAIDPEHPQVLARGELMIEAPAAKVSEKVISALRGGLQGVGPVRIEEGNDRRISGEVTFVGSMRGPTGRSPMGGGTFFTVEFSALGSRTSASYRILGSGGGCLKTSSALLVHGVIPVVLAAAGFLIPTFIVKNEDPSVRYQVFQTFQIIHVLWPSFLLAALRGMGAKAVTKALITVLQNSAF